MGLEGFRRVGEVDQQLEAVRRAEIETIQSAAKERSTAIGARATKEIVGIPYVGDEDRTVIDVHLPADDRANLPA